MSYLKIDIKKVKMVMFENRRRKGKNFSTNPPINSTCTGLLIFFKMLFLKYIINHTFYHFLYLYTKFFWKDVFIFLYWTILKKTRIYFKKIEVYSKFESALLFKLFFIYVILKKYSTLRENPLGKDKLGCALLDNEKTHLLK